MNDLFLLKKPDLGSIDIKTIFKRFEEGGNQLTDEFNMSNEPIYLYWDKVKNKQLKTSFSKEEFWFLLKQLRKFSSKKTPVKSENGNYFTWLRLPYTDEFLHKIDMHFGGQMFNNYSVLSDINKQKFISRGILEEAIASSQLEGAHTTRKVAKKMLLEKRKPRNESERMIVNNYKTIEALNENFKDRRLDKEMLFELHRMLTENTDIEVEDRGRYRNDDDDIKVVGFIGGQEEMITHIPPKHEFLVSEMKKLIDYANDVDQDNFLHPVIKAIFIHFWVGYLHPFVDGNGRLARTLFYWYLMRNGYWSFIYLPISTVIKKSPIQYAKAYIYSEQDDCDITYFYDYNMRKIIQALDEFDNYIKEQVEENKKVNNLLKGFVNINDRQKNLLHYLLADEEIYTTITSHSSVNGIVRQTAYRDLNELIDQGLLSKEKNGRYVHYMPTEKLKDIVDHIF